MCIHQVLLVGNKIYLYACDCVRNENGISDWDQYREVFEAIVASNGWDELTAALQLIAHLDGEALNVALLVPDD